MAFSLSTLDEQLGPIAGWLGTFALHSSVALLLTGLFARIRGQRSLSLQDSMLRQAMWLPFLSATLQFVFFGSVWGGLLAEPMVTTAELAPLMSMVVAEPTSFAQATPFVAVATPWPWATITVVATLVCSLIGLAWLWRTWRGLTRILSTRRPETDPRVLSAAATMAADLGLRQSPHISRADQLSTPIAFGFLRPEICLPARAATLDEGSLRAMLGHELAHLRRADPAWMWLAAWIHALFPWQLLLISVRRQWSRVVELRCDAEAAHCTSATAVARCLIEVAEWLRPQPVQSMVALGMAARPSALRERVEAVLCCGEPPATRRLAAGGMAVLSLATLTLAAPGLGDRVITGLTARDFAIALNSRPTSSVAGLQPFVDLVEQEYAAVVADADALKVSLLLHLPTQSTRLQSLLQQRLTVLARLRARLLARIDRNASLNR